MRYIRDIRYIDRHDYQSRDTTFTSKNRTSGIYKKKKHLIPIS
jgi:hypothetical protein